MSDKKSKVQVVREFFGMNSKEMMTEWKPLSEADRSDLAVGAAKAMKLTQDEVNFDLG